nr:hypothetical protein [Tanacetum cinerariifolium]
MAFLEKTKEQIKEEDSRALKRINESQEDKAAKKQKINEEVEELRKHLQIVPNNNDDVYIEATPLVLKMLNNVRLEVEEESEVSLELLRRRYALSCNANGKPIGLILGLQKDPYNIVLGVKGPIVPLLLVAPDPSFGELEASVDKLFDEGGSGEQVDQGDSTGDGHGVGVQLVDGSAKTIAEDVAPAELQCRKKRKTKVVDVGEPSHPAKKAVHHAEVRGGAVPTLPFVSSSVSTTSDRKGGDCTELLAGANLRTLEATQRFVISLDSSDPLGVNIAEAEVDYVVRTSVPIMTNATTATPTDDLAAIAKEKLVSASVFGGDSSSAGRSHPIYGGISDRTGGDFLVGGIRIVVEPDSNLQIVYVPYWNVTNGFCMDDGGVYREMVEEFPPKFFASIRGIEHDQLFTEFNVRAARHISLGAKGYAKCRGQGWGYAYFTICDVFRFYHARTTPTVDPAAIAKEKLVGSSVFGVDSPSAGESHPIPGGFSDCTVYVPQWNVTNGSCLDDGGVCRDMVDESPPPQKFFASVYGMKHEQLFTEFNGGVARRMSLSAEVRMRANYNIRESKRLNSVIEEKDALLKAKDEEIDSLKAEQEVADLDVVVTSVKLHNDNLVDQVHKLEASFAGLQKKVMAYENYLSQLEKFQDNWMREMNDKFDKLDADLIEMALHLEERILSTSFDYHFRASMASYPWIRARHRQMLELY